MATAYQTLMQQQRNEQPFAGATAEIVALRAARLIEYRRLLAAHDVHYEMSDDHGAYSRGYAQRQLLRAMQPDLDPDRLIWSQFIRGV